jgi:hypothetical protein
MSDSYLLPHALEQSAQRFGRSALILNDQDFSRLFIE